MKSRLLSSGFQQLDEADISWKSSVIPGGKYFYIRGGSSIVIVTIGGAFKPGNGVKILGAHTDSPNLKLKPKSKRGKTGSVIQLNVEAYGGGLWHTWFDRDLSLAGRISLCYCG